MGEAPRNGMVGGSWSSGYKQVLGTAYEAYDRNGRYSSASPTAPLSRVWYTGTQGVLSEVFWPTVDRPQVKDSQFLVTDGQGFFFEERQNSVTQVGWVKPGVPAFTIINRERQNRFQIEKTIFSDPDRDVVIQHVRITRNVPGLNFFILHKPNVGATPMDDTAVASDGERGIAAGLYAYQQGEAQALIASVAFKQVSAGFTGASDGWTDLTRNHTMAWSYATATNGNVALTGWLDLPANTAPDTVEFDIALGFAQDPTTARGLAAQSLAVGANALLTKFSSQWDAYQGSVRNLAPAANDGGALFRASVALIKSMEDKTFPGAFVASPCFPWGDHLPDNSAGAPTKGGYHLVWPRDLYQMATAFLALDDLRSAAASLEYLRTRQLGPQSPGWSFGPRQTPSDGSWFQNSYVNGATYWTGLQMDETAMPIVLAYRLWQRGAIAWQNYWDMVRRGADFILRFGPWTAQERWEENFGASPSTIASEISALVVAAEFAQQAGDQTRAATYLATAKAWANKPGDNIDTWTFTTSGSHGTGHYYERVEGAGGFDQTWNPNDDGMFFIANLGGRRLERDIVDAGFLELVRFGVKNATAQTVAESMVAVDQTIRVNIPGVGPGFHRYIGDMYNYDGVSGQQTPGMLWPLLSGERGHYELERALESRLGPAQVDAAVSPFVTTMERMATQQLMLPEQVWESGPGIGQPTGSATPLGWAHGEYIKLLRSRSERAIFDRLPIVITALDSR
jgi:glucoamylase